MGKAQLSVIVVLVIAALFAFQNCGEITLNAHDGSSVAAAAQGISGVFCSSVNTSDELNHFMIVNLTSLPKANALLSVSNLGTVRIAGVDSDADGIPDFIETLRGMNPAVADAFADEDQDGSSNLDELGLGTDMKSSENPPELNIYNVAESGPFSGCAPGQKVYRFEVTHLQKVYTLLFEDTVNSGRASLSHASDENVFLIFADFSDATGANIKKLFHLFKVRKNDDAFSMALTPADFSELPP